MAAVVGGIDRGDIVCQFKHVAGARAYMVRSWFGHCGLSKPCGMHQEGEVQPTTIACRGEDMSLSRWN